MKKILLSMMAFASISPLTVVSAAYPAPPFIPPISVVLNGSPLDFSPAPFARSGVTVVPFRQLFEALDAEVDYIDETQTIIAKTETTTIKLTLDSFDAYVNDQKHTLTRTPFSLNGTTYVGLRFISETLGGSVGFIKGSKENVITIDWGPR
ncbi:copper amine oxidase N-terminal domain-containing protein [Paenibacillus xanthanilyticus]|uniref:Copper amine oxidase N-terminal domain-containing protein n=1 Tax=Paenibacillus xanthanilyticus TaxID=1783531 RepID=A0ABV8KE19_9BACL